jgi:hypothetical protein
MIDRKAILDVMEAKAGELFAAGESYQRHGRRGSLVVQVRDGENPAQWDSSLRSFGPVIQAPGTEAGFTVNNGVNFEALAHGKIAYTRRTGKDSGVNYYEVLGNESWWRGAVISGDGACICAFSGLMGQDDLAIAQAGLAEYERQKDLDPP